MALLLLLALQDFDRLMRDLGADDVDVREKATKDLLGLGRDAVPRVRAAWERETDPEIKSRLRLHLRAFDMWSEELLATLPEGSRRGDAAALSADGRHVAYIDESGSNGMVWVVDGKPTEAFLALPEGFAFSPYGSRTAFVACVNDDPKNRFAVVIDGKHGEIFDGVSWLRFTRDGKDVIYLAQIGDKWKLLRNETTIETFGERPDFMVAPDGQTIVFFENESIRIGDAVSESFESIGQRMFMPDGKTFACVGFQKDKWYLVNGTVKVQTFERQPLLDPDGEHLPMLGPDGRVAAFWVCAEGKEYFIVDGRKTESYAAISVPVVGPDGRTIAFAAMKEKDLVDDPQRWRLVVGKKESEEFDTIWRPVFSPDGKKVAFGARRGRELWWKVMDVE